MNPRQIALKVADEYRRILIAGGDPDFVVMVTEAIEQFKEKTAAPPKCEWHIKYTGKRKPRTPCESCWRLYLWNKDNK